MIRKNLDLIIVALFTSSLVLYDVTLDLLEEFFHLMLEVLHNLFEWVELGVEQVVEKIFHHLHLGETVAYLFITERHGSQVVTFYFLVAVIFYFVVRLSRFAPGLYTSLKRATLMSWIRRKTQIQLYWHSLTPLHKAALVATALFILVLGSFFVI
jgi:hypothetical protein